MSSQINLTAREFSRGPQRWRVDAAGRWSVLMFGWWPNHNGRPEWRWVDVDRHRVPAELIAASQQME